MTHLRPAWRRAVVGDRRRPATDAAVPGVQTAGTSPEGRQGDSHTTKLDRTHAAPLSQDQKLTPLTAPDDLPEGRHLQNDTQAG